MTDHSHADLPLKRIANVLELGETVLLALPAVASDVLKFLWSPATEWCSPKIMSRLSRVHVIRSEPPGRAAIISKLRLMSWHGSAASYLAG